MSARSTRSAMRPTDGAQFEAGYFDIPDAVYEGPAKFVTQRNNMRSIAANSPKTAEAAE